MGETSLWKFYSATTATGVADLYVFAPIGDLSPIGIEGGVTAEAFAKELAGLKGVSTINVRINSPGGLPEVAATMFNALRRHGARVITHAEGNVSSAATILYEAGDERHAVVNALFNYHMPWTSKTGNAAALRKAADDLDAMMASMLTIYESRTTLSRDELTALLADDRFIGAEEAKSLGFVDVIDDYRVLALRQAPGRWVINGIAMAFTGAEPPPALAATLKTTVQEMQTREERSKLNERRWMIDEALYSALWNSFRMWCDEKATGPALRSAWDASLTEYRELMLEWVDEMIALRDGDPVSAGADIQALTEYAERRIIALRGSPPITDPPETADQTHEDSTPLGLPGGVAVAADSSAVPGGSPPASEAPSCDKAKRARILTWLQLKGAER